MSGQPVKSEGRTNDNIIGRLKDEIARLRAQTAEMRIDLKCNGDRGRLREELRAVLYENVKLREFARDLWEEVDDPATALPTTEVGYWRPRARDLGIVGADSQKEERP